MNKSDIANEYKKMNFSDLRGALKELQSRKANEKQYDHKLRLAILKSLIAQREIAEIEKEARGEQKRKINNAKYALGGIVHQLLLNKQITADDFVAFVRRHDEATTAFEKMKPTERQNIHETTGVLFKEQSSEPETQISEEAPSYYEYEHLKFEWKPDDLCWRVGHVPAKVGRLMMGTERNTTLDELVDGTPEKYLDPGYLPQT